jgi:hypothetical protein
MLDFNESNRRSDNNEAVVREQFEKLGYSVDRLDTKSSKGRRPDFLISDRAGRPQMLCEVKTVDTGGYQQDKADKRKGFWVSTHDDKLGKFECPVSLRKIDEKLADAVDKRKTLVQHDSSFADLPLLVAFFFDQLAEFLPFHRFSFDKRDERFPEVSGILTIKYDAERDKVFDKLSDEEKERYLKNPKLMDDDLPPSSKDFILLQNEPALRAIPDDFECQCLPDADYG